MQMRTLDSLQVHSTTVFQKHFQLFIGRASFFHFPLCLLAKTVFCALQNTKLTFRKIFSYGILYPP